LAAAATGTVAYGTWLAGRPSAGGKLPLWQLLHWPATAICVWFQAVGRHAVKLLWQVSHDSVVGIWLAGLPVALPAPWQVVHVPATTPAWSKLAAGDHALVRWQLSHDADV
jgi:hypothetical protein